jgi:hypothetical protein
VLLIPSPGICCCCRSDPLPAAARQASAAATDQAMAHSDDDAAAAAARADEAKRLADEARAARDQALAAKEAANTTLHTQAIAVINIKILIPVTLEKPANNYGRWRSLFIIVLGKYNLKDHVLSDDSYPERSAWSTMDCCVLTWVYGTVSNDLYNR